MSSPPLIKFTKNAEFLDDNASAHLELSLIKDLAVAEALAKNEPFTLPPEGKIELGQIQARAAPGREIAFKGRNGRVGFSGGAGAFVGIGVYNDPKELLNALDLADSIAPGMELERNSDAIYLALRSGYDVNASAKGALALGAPGALRFGVDGQREAAYAVVRRFDKAKGARAALEETAGNWMLPARVDSAEQLDPATWLIAEVDGSIAVKLGARYGYDFNWIREAKLGGITGDIGLRLQLSLAATLEFGASGKYAVVLSRESPDAAAKLLRLRLFKQRIRKWNFAFNAGAGVKADLDDFLPKHLDEFIASVFTVHSAQIVYALKAIDKWTDPNRPVIDLVAEVGVDYAQKFLQEVTGIDSAQQFNAARDRVREFIDRWHDLDHRVATAVWKLVEEKVDLKPLRDLAGRIAGVDRSVAKELLRDVLKDVRYFDTPEGKWLAAAAADGIMRALASSDEFARLQDAAKKTVAVLDGSKLENVLSKLQDYINGHLHLKQIEAAIDRTDFDKVDEWLKARLAAFLGVKLADLDFARIDEVRQAIRVLRGKSKEFYEAGRAALARRYEAELIGTYQRETTRTALLDVVFDFGADAAVLPGVAQSLRDAVDGKFDGLLVEARPGVSLNEATLTHQIKRQAHIELSLPFFKHVGDHLNTSFARVAAIEDDGRVLVYELEAEDIAVERAKIYRHSRLAIGVHWPHKIGSDVRVHSAAELSYTYSFRQAKARMKRADLQYQLKPYVTLGYFRHVFSAAANDGDGGSKAVSGSYDTWIGDMDRAIDKLPEGGPDNDGTDKFGNTLISLELSPESEVVAGWLRGSKKEKKDPIYMEMSRRLQRRMKELITFYYFQNPKKYGDLVPASVLLVYASLPPLTTFKISNGRLEETHRDIYWNWPDASGEREALVRSPETAANLIERLGGVHARLMETPGLEGLAAHYHPGRFNAVRSLVLGGLTSGLNPGRTLLGNLLMVEAEVVKGARDAGVELARFIENANSKPTAAIEALAKFGAGATGTFNSSLGSVFGGEVLRPMGTMLFVEAARTLALKPAEGGISAMLDLVVLKQNSTFALDSFIKGRNPAKHDILFEQRLINIT